MSGGDVADAGDAEWCVAAELTDVRAFLDAVETVIVSLDVEGLITSINRKGCELLGRREEDLLGRPWFAECLPQPEGLETMLPLFRRIIAGEIDEFEHFENPIVNAEGEWRDVAWHNALLRDADGNVTGTLSAGDDITERKRADAALALSESRLREAQRVAGVGNWEWHPQTGYLYWSEENYRLFDLDPGTEPSMEVWTERLAPGESQRVGAAIAAALEGADYDIDMRIVVRDGSERIIHSVGECERDASGAPVRMYGTIQDVTETRRAEAALRESEALYHDLVETSQDLIWQCDAEGRYTYLNRAWEEVLGRPGADMLGRRFADFQPPAAAERDRDEFGRLLEGGTVKGYETVHLKADGSEVHLVFNAKRVCDENGEVVGTRGTAFDVTSRKKAAEAIRQSRDLLRYVVEHARSSVAIHDRDLRYIYVSQRYLDEYGVKDRDVIGKHHYDVFPNLPEKWRIAHRKALVGEVSSAEDDPYEREDGSVDWTSWECRPWYEADGTIGGIVVYTAIVSERRRAALALQESEARYRALVEHSPLAIFVQKDGRVEYANQECVALFGVAEPKELVGRRVCELLPADGCDEVERLAAGARSAAQSPTVAEARILRMDGVLREVQIAAAPFEERGDKLVHVVLRDITERKRVARENAEYQSRMGELAAELLRSGDRERSRLAVELHDSVGQSLVAAKIDAQQAVSGCRDEETAGLLRRLIGLLDYSIEGVRTITAELSPPVLRSLGLGSAVEWLADTFESRYGLECDARVDGSVSDLRNDAAVLLFRTARELLNNVQRHSGARSARLDLSPSGDMLELRVEDEGCGFDADVRGAARGARESFGLFSIAEEVRLAGGAFEISSVRGAGTCAVARVPLDLDWARKDRSDDPVLSPD